MKKRKSLLIAVMVIAATAATLFVGCKKEKDEAAATADRSEAQALLNRIEAFQTLRDAVNSGAKADGSMTVEEMRQALDLVSNYEHSEHMTYCLNTVLDTLHVAMPTVDGEGRVSETDVVATYNAFETALEKCMLGVNDGMDVPSYFSIVMPKSGAKDDNDIDIVFLRGEADEAPGNEEHTSDGPFREDIDDWKWGLNLGLCNPQGPFNCNLDAADKLSEQFVFTPGLQHQGQTFFPYEVDYGKYAPCETSLLPGYVYYVDPNMEDCASTWLFYEEDSIIGPDFVEPCIFYDEMNCYWRSIRRNIVLPNAPLHFGPLYHSPYHKCIISDKLFKRQTARVHLADVVYCYVFWEEPVIPPVH